MDNLILVRGGGDLATGTIYKLRQCGFPVLVLETETPSAIRRNVAFSEAVYQGKQTVEDMTCYLAASIDQAEEFLQEGKLALLVDPEGACIPQLKPLAVVDAILAKKNLGTSRDMAPITVALGPGFEAGVDVDAVVETKRGHRLGRCCTKAAPLPTPEFPESSAAMARNGCSTAPRREPSTPCLTLQTPSAKDRPSLWWKRRKELCPSGPLWTACFGD